MLGGAIQAVEGMASNTATEFEQGFEVGGTDSVWFDCECNNPDVCRLAY